MIIDLEILNDNDPPHHTTSATVNTYELSHIFPTPLHTVHTGSTTHTTSTGAPSTDDAVFDASILDTGVGDLGEEIGNDGVLEWGNLETILGRAAGMEGGGEMGEKAASLVSASSTVSSPSTSAKHHGDNVTNNLFPNVCCAEDGVKVEKEIGILEDLLGKDLGSVSGEKGGKVGVVVKEEAVVVGDNFNRRGRVARDEEKIHRENSTGGNGNDGNDINAEPVIANRSLVGNNRSKLDRDRISNYTNSDTGRVPTKEKIETIEVRLMKAEVKKELDERQKERLALRKQRNKDSARKYREKQLAKRRQLEERTRLLSVQNQELEDMYRKIMAVEKKLRVLGMGGTMTTPKTVST